MIIVCVLSSAVNMFSSMTNHTLVDHCIIMLMISRVYTTMHHNNVIVIVDNEGLSELIEKVMWLHDSTMADHMSVQYRVLLDLASPAVPSSPLLGLT